MAANLGRELGDLRTLIEAANADCRTLMEQALALKAIGETPKPDVLRNRLGSMKKILSRLASMAVSENFSKYVQHLRNYVVIVEKYLDKHDWKSVGDNVNVMPTYLNGAEIEAQKAGVL